MSGRSGEFGAAVGACALAGALGLFSGGRVWLELAVDRAAPLPPTHAELTGSTLAPVVAGLSIVVLAGVVGLLATRGLARIAVGIALGAAGAGMIAAASPWLGGGSANRVRAAAFDAGLPASEVRVLGGSGGAWLAVGAGVLAVLAGLAAVVRGRAWPGMGTRFDRAVDGAAVNAGAVDRAAVDGPPAAADAVGYPDVAEDPAAVGDPDSAADPASTEQINSAGLPAASSQSVTGHPGSPGPPEAVPDPTADRRLWDALDHGEDPTRR